MTIWWIADASFPGALNSALEKIARGMRPDCMLLLDCDPPTAIDARRRIAESSMDTRVYVMLHSWLKALSKAPRDWPELCIRRLLEKHGATRVTWYPSPGKYAIHIDPARPEDVSGLQNPTRPAFKAPLAFVSPLPPEHTGIASYSGELIEHLAARYDITLVSETDAPRLAPGVSGLPRMGAATFAACTRKFERIVYQIGNSLYHAWQFDLLRHYPGLVVLHDYFLFDAVWWRDQTGRSRGLLRSSLYEDHGYAAAAALDAHDGSERGPEQYPVNGCAIRNAAGIVVHSGHALALHRLWHPELPKEDVSVIPHLRKLPEEPNRKEGRRALGLDDETLVIASFGGMNPKKGVDRIVEAFLQAGSDLPGNTLLVFAGSENTDAFGARMRKMLGGHPRGRQVIITGYLSGRTYRQWLCAADIAIQLRIRTRGESSGAVLDAMAHGLPLITNKHGSNAELPGHAAYLLTEDPDPETVRRALAELASSPADRAVLGQNARDWIRRMHDPESAAFAYSRAIEKSRIHPAMKQSRWFDEMAASARHASLTPDDLKSLSSPLQKMGLLYNPRPKRLLIDVSVIAHHDLKTGIERVTREMSRRILENPPDGLRVELVRWHNGQFHLAVSYAAGLLGLAAPPAPDRPAEPAAGDIYLSFEWAPFLLENAENTFQEMKAAGVRLCFTVHDLLPLRLPACFPGGTSEKMRSWFYRMAGLADDILCVSAHVAREVETELGRMDLPARPVVSHFYPGADFPEPNHGNRKFSERRQLAAIDAAPRPRILMVGTLEPRKGHAQVMEAAECLWRGGQNFSLVLAGKKGWNVDGLARRIKTHPERGRRLFWCNMKDDDFLCRIYRRSDVLMAASMGEGFGLPVIEAARHGLSVFARDIPVFREVAGDAARYFTAESGPGLAEEIAAWIRLWKAGGAVSCGPLAYNTWNDSVNQLEKALFRMPPSGGCQ